MTTFSAENVERYAKAVMGLVNLSVYLAAPRFAKTQSDLPDHEHILTHLDEYIECVERFGSSVNEDKRDIMHTVPFARSLRICFEACRPNEDFSDEVCLASRAFLRAFGIDEPVEGWDAFEGWADQ